MVTWCNMSTKNDATGDPWNAENYSERGRVTNEYTCVVSTLVVAIFLDPFFININTDIDNLEARHSR